uniref:UBC core domain-containing protein n=1 Tax=Ficedula albicollis TaxID=59894 RepID=U3K8Y0_FICAL
MLAPSIKVCPIIKPCLLRRGSQATPPGGVGLRCPPIPRQNNPPYNTGAFRFELTFSPNHPLEPPCPPCATLRTPIYHPSVDLGGHVCQPLTTHGHWEPTTRAIQVLQDLLLQLDSPDPQRVLRPNVARELQERPEEFRRRAEEHTRLHAEPRPDPRT